MEGGALRRLLLDGLGGHGVSAGLGGGGGIALALLGGGLLGLGCLGLAGVDRVLLLGGGGSDLLGLLLGGGLKAGGQRRRVNLGATPNSIRHDPHKLRTFKGRCLSLGHCQDGQSSASLYPLVFAFPELVNSFQKCLISRRINSSPSPTRKSNMESPPNRSGLQTFDLGDSAMAR